jgi:protein-L-isoaspartate(D-aspartate) O-methyltransferase
MVGIVTDDLLLRYATSVTAGLDEPAVEAAFARIPRHLFVPQILDADGAVVPATPEIVYSDEALVTRRQGGWPTSSSSQPSLMARMLAALRLRAGLRVLEIGAGTGYNAALIATITGAPVVSVDVQSDVVAEARTALDLAGVDGVRVEVGDGYLGAPDGAPYDRIVATVGVAGVPPAWLDQLAPGGLILAPIEHAGLQPCVLAVPDRDHGLTGRATAASGFMLAAGRLHPHGRQPDPLPVGRPPPMVTIPSVPDRRYYDLWFALAAWDPRIGRRLVEGYSDDRAQCVLTDPVEGSVLVERDALRPIAATPALVEHLRSLVARWHAVGAPLLAEWRCGFRFVDSLWVPVGWRLGPAEG